MGSRPGLTDEQMAVVAHRDGHGIVTAVAGSGKSETLIARVLSNLRNGMTRNGMLILMYNTAARESFESRLTSACAEEALPCPPVFTFHSYSLRLCSRLEKLGLLPEKVLLTDQKKLMRFAREAIMEVNQWRPEGSKIDPYGDAPLEILSIMEMKAGDLDVVPEHVPEEWIPVLEAFDRIREREDFRMFAHLISDPVIAARNNPEIASCIGGHYDEILVDEFQDINESQIQLVKLLASDRARVIGVGDDDQCIYSWRGARPEYMVSLFGEMFPGTRRLPLSKTFRFGPALAAAANRVISHNVNRIKKEIVSGAPIETQVELRIAEPWRRTGDEVAVVLNEWMTAGRSLSEAVVLVREFSLTASIEPSLIGGGIPYRITGSLPFFNRAELLAMEFHLWLAAGGSPNDESLGYEMTRAALSNPTLYMRHIDIDAMASKCVGNPRRVSTELRHMASKYKDFRARHLKTAADWFDRSAMSAWAGSAEQFLRDVLKRTEFISFLNKQHPRPEVARNRIGIVLEMVKMANAADTIPTLLERIDNLRSSYRSLGDGQDVLLITSIHRSKGLEWPLVILPELSDGALPYLQPDGAIEDYELEDERRLMYVAMTRARERLVMFPPSDGRLLSWLKANRDGHPEGHITASRFLYEAGKTIITSKGDCRLQAAGEFGKLILRQPK